MLYHAEHGVDTVALRYFSVYGPRQRPDMAFRRFCEAALAGEPIELFGDGRQTRDFTYVADVVAAVPRGGRGADGGRRRASTTSAAARASASNDALELLAAIAGRPLDVRRRERESGDVRDTGADIERAREELGFAPATTLATGLRAEFEWVLEHRAHAAAPSPPPAENWCVGTPLVRVPLGTGEWPGRSTSKGLRRLPEPRADAAGTEPARPARQVRGSIGRWRSAAWSSPRPCRGGRPRARAARRTGAPSRGADRRRGRPVVVRSFAIDEEMCGSAVWRPARHRRDALPQLWSVVRGEMSIIGPRPREPGFEPPPARPGLTGLAQLEQLERWLSVAEQLELDDRYARTWSLGLDARIVWRTMWPRP